MFTWVKNKSISCWKPINKRYGRDDSDDDDDDDVYNARRDGIDGDFTSDGDMLLWSRVLGRHSYGDFSMSVVQANEVIEDHSQVETADGAVFIGVYDGHGGPETSRYVSDHLFPSLMRISKEQGDITEETVKAAYAETEGGFLTLVQRTMDLRPLMCAVGSCCLVGVIWRGNLIIANAGDSRAVLGYVKDTKKPKKILSEPLTNDHNAGIEEIRQELRAAHPNDPNIVVLRQDVWRVKGIIQISRTIGDAYLKRAEFGLGPAYPKFHLRERLERPVLSAEPSVYSRVLQASDKFVIFASDGLWENLSNQEAVEIVHKYPRAGIATRLVRKSMKIGSKKRKTSFAELKTVPRGDRRVYHDDITVVVVFIDEQLLMVEKAIVPMVSIKGFSDVVGASQFSVFFS